MEQQHKNSRKVRVKRAPSFISKAQGADTAVQDYLAQASMAIGSYWENTGSRRIGSGLTIGEEKLILPDLLGVSSEDREYFQKRNDFFASIETKVPAGDGIELEIGLESSNTQPLSKDNLPLNVSDYIKYRHALKHPWVSTSESEASGNQLVKFYIHDEVVATADVASASAIKDDALEYYLSIKKSPEKVNMMLTLLGIEYRDIKGQTEIQTQQLRTEKLRSLVESQAAEIVKLHEDKDFEVKYNIQMLVNTGIIKRVGAKHLIAETSESLGNEEEIVEFFKDEAANSQTLGVLKAKLQEALKAGKRTKKTTTTR